MESSSSLERHFRQAWVRSRASSKEISLDGHSSLLADQTADLNPPLTVCGGREEAKRVPCLRRSELEMGALSFANLLGHQFDTFCENLNAIGRIFSKSYRHL